MKKSLIVAATALSLVAGVALAKEVKDWHDIHAAHDHVSQAIKEMDQARAANHYDMAGHGAKAADLLRQAEKEIRDSIEAAKNEK